MPTRPNTGPTPTTPCPLDSDDDLARILDRDGRWRLFRDNNPHGLRLDTHGNRWSLTREHYTRTTTASGERWKLVGEPLPTCLGGWDTQRQEYIARRLPAGTVIASGDTQYGVLARAARRCLPNARHPTRSGG